MLKYKVLLFDLDGTLCNTDEMIVQSFFSLYKEFEPIKLRTREEIYYFSGPPIKETLKNEFPKYDSLMMYQAFQKISKELYEPYVVPFQGEIEILKKLKEEGYLLGVVTNKGLPLTIYSLEICHINDLFDVIISADDVNIPKPDPSGINKALEKLNIQNKEEVLSKWQNDIKKYAQENMELYIMVKNLNYELANSKKILKKFKCELVNQPDNILCEISIGCTEENEYVLLIQMKEDEIIKIRLIDVEYIRMNKQQNALDVSVLHNEKFKKFRRDGSGCDQRRRSR